MRERQSVVAVVATRYRKARKREKKAILNEFIELTSYTCSYGALLRAQGKRVRVNDKTVLVGEMIRKRGKEINPGCTTIRFRGRSRGYGFL